MARRRKNPYTKWKSQAERTAQAMIERYGYIVVRNNPRYPVLKVGMILDNLWLVPTEQPFHVIAKASFSEWQQQRKVAEEVTGIADTAEGDNSTAYFRAVTD